MSHRAYLDHNAAAPLHPAARAAMEQALHLVGNPSSQHAEGQAARARVEDARALVAGLLGARERDLTFTSGATEALHHVIHGVLAATARRTVVTTTVEHHAVLDELASLEERGRVRVRRVGVDAHGVVDAAAWSAAMDDDVALACLLWANNETGVVQPVRRLLKVAREACGAFTLLDAAQVPGRLELVVPSMAADAVVVSAAKFGGPRGVGACWMDGSAAAARWRPPRRGGAQERGRRPGTENVVGVAGMGAAAAAVSLEDVERIRTLRDTLENRLRRRFPDVVVHGAGAERLGNTAFIGFPGADAQLLLMLLDQAGVAASSGSACVSGATTPSHVLAAMGVPTGLARASVRFSLGMGSTEEDVELALVALEHAVPRARDG
ncbi:MAG: cysteine desulfurase [Deltaproteobacteria bacterium]|nr:cysteine desulfurase [Deltaproteobacteria bacterium]